jgi:phosphoribosylanthranilate isomerase
VKQKQSVVRVKICGITRQQDADAAVEAGVNALGFIFTRTSPRYVSEDTAREIIRSLPSSVIPVGVFVNERRKEIERMVESTGIRTLQMHGDESPDDVDGYVLPVWKGLRVGYGFDVSVLSRYSSSAFVLDAFSNDQYGGTGKTIDWNIAVQAKKFGNIILSGGMTPENIKQAVETVAPYAVDINSGVEVSPGIKDNDRINQLFAALRQI